MYDASSATRGGHTRVFEKGEEASVEFRQHLPLAAGTYHISAHVTCTERRIVSDWQGNAISFEVVGTDLTAGVVSLQSAVDVDGSCVVPEWAPVPLRRRGASAESSRPGVSDHSTRAERRG